MSEKTQDYPLTWIDEYIDRLRDFIFVREADNLLIKVPNEAHKLNDSGIQILKRLLAGESIADLHASFGGTEEVRKDLYTFFIGLKQLLQGCLNEHHLPDSVVQRPFDLGFCTLPVLSEVAITYRCNLGCRFCYAGCSCKKSENAREMTAEECKQVLRVIRNDAQVPSTSFTGGEPTLRADLPELIHYARHDLGMRVNLITNGTLVDETLAENLKSAGLHSAQVSLESPDEATHDRLTQVRGSFGKSMAGIRNLKSAGLRVHTNTTINRENLSTLVDMPAFVANQGLERFSMNMVIPCGTSSSQADINLRYTEISEVILQISRASERAGVEFMWYSPTPVCIFNPIPHRLGNKGCAACDGLLSVSPAGDVLPCSSWDEPTGNLLRQPFTEVWESTRATWIRNKEFAPGLCHRCEDFALCQSGCPLYWKHFGYAELEICGEQYVAAAG